MTKTMNAAKALLLAAGVAVAIVPTAGFAKGDRHGPRVDFETLDADGNGEVTQAEMAAMGAARFNEADTDGDGFLTKDEISAKAGERRAKRLDRMFEKRDANNDGKLSAEELAPPADRIAKRFEKVDTDGNGSISKAEFDAAKEHRKGRRKPASE